jgi:hypothetical protein
LNTQDDPLWDACLAKVKEMERKGWRMASRSAAYHSQQGPRKEPVPRLCIFKAYAPGDAEMAISYVFEIEAWYSSHYQHKGEIEVQIKGPYEDSHDHYWLGMHRADNDPKGLQLWIVTPDYCHYTISKDSRNPGQGDGYGGRLFAFAITSDESAERMTKAGLKISDYNHDGEDWYKLESRNVWLQGFIPPKHRHLWTPNAEIVPTPLIVLPEGL